MRVYGYNVKNGGTRYRARCLYRDFDGVVRPVERRGKTKAEAINNLRAAIRDRAYAVADADITRDTKVRIVATYWFEEIRGLERSPSTIEKYKYQYDRHIDKAIGDLRICEVTVGRLDKLLKTVRSNTRVKKRYTTESNKGAANARMVRTVLTGILGLAVRHDALDVNPMRDVGRIEGASKPARALTLRQAQDLRAKIHADPRARRRDVIDLADMMLGTGFRIGETAALLLDWCDVDEATVQVRGTVIRVKGLGLVLKWKPKSKAGFRTVELATWTNDMVRKRWKKVDRYTEVTTYDPQHKTYRREQVRLLFPAALGGLRDPSNTEADFRELFDDAGYEWVTSHVYRKTVATLMDEAGLSARAAADQLGHANVSMTQDVYFGRGSHRTGAAAVLQGVVVEVEGGKDGG